MKPSKLNLQKKYEKGKHLRMYIVFCEGSFTGRGLIKNDRGRYQHVRRFY